MNSARYILEKDMQYVTGREVGYDHIFSFYVIHGHYAEFVSAKM